MKVVERVLENRLCITVSVDEMQFGFMSERVTIDAVFIFKWLQEEYHAKGKRLYMCFEDLEITFDIAPRKALEEVLVMSLYEGVKTRVSVDSELSEEFKVKGVCTKDLCCHLFLLWW